MGHHHHHHASTGNIKVAFLLNFSFTIIEFIGGLLTNSMAIMSDALHDLGDSLSLGLSWYFQNLSKKEGNNTFSFGYRRFSLLAALINSIILLLGSMFILKEAIPRIWSPEETNATGMALLAVLGILVNGAAVFKLKSGHSMNERVVTLHLLEDVLGWVAVLIVSIMLYFTDWYFLDPLLSVMISVYILTNVFRNLKQTMMIFLEAVPSEVSLPKIKKRIEQIQGVISTHHTHFWSMDGEHHALSTHVVVDNKASKEEIIKIKDQIRQLQGDFHLSHLTIDVEYEDENCEFRT
ncbi:cation diffusion facilitator family transporter [Bacillus solimangrovi]|uniref:Cobalt transporter n=1 Tax=Bacillus solimangrovi TaxID=1305675 RepID=A0A1E5LFA0_9BACI|nr:cation diffusion facilitator family transporter [Bacillus solimangrovi]OEH92765.1 cobalt transporter [Bacillus solimangrovi]